MALHRLLEQEPLEPFSVTGCAPMSGPYDISGVQSAVIIDDQPYPTPGYLPYVALSYQEVYGNLYSDLEELFLPEYAAVIPDLFDGTHSMGEINAAFPNIPNQMLQPDALEDFESNPEHPIALALAQNDVYDWAPVAPTRLYYCEGDDQVNYMNSVVALEAMTANGAAQIDAVDGGMLDHGACAPLAMLAGFNWFIDLYEPAFDPQIVATVTQIEESRRLRFYRHPRTNRSGMELELVQWVRRVGLGRTRAGALYLHTLQWSGVRGGFRLPHCCTDRYRGASRGSIQRLPQPRE